MKPDNRQWEDYAEDILDAVESIEEFIRGITYNEFISDKKTNYAVIRSIEIIGEAAKSIPDHVRKELPDIPWKDMAGMRDKMIHHYFGIDFKVVWKTINEDIPMIKPMLQNMVNKFVKDDEK